MISKCRLDYHYPAAKRAIHWLVSSLLILQISLMLVFKQLHSLEMGQFVLLAHRQCGIALLLTVLARFALFIQDQERPFDSFPVWQSLLAKSVHTLLYSGLALQALLGVALSWSQGDQAAVLDLIQLPVAWRTSPSIAPFFQNVHRWNMIFLTALLALHIFAIAYHRIVEKTQVLDRIIGGQEDNRIINRASLSMQLFGVCGVILVLCAASGLYAANQFKSFEDMRTRFVENDLTSSDVIRATLHDLKSLTINRSDRASLPADMASSINDLADRLKSIENKVAEQSVANELNKSIGALDAAMTGGSRETVIEALDRATSLLQSAADGQAMVVFQQNLSVSQQARKGHDLIILTIAPTAMISAVLVFLVSRNIFLALRRISKVVHNVTEAEAGERHVHHEVVGDGELARLMRDVLVMKQTIETRQRRATEKRVAAMLAIERELERRLAALEQANSELTSFSDTLSHDLRTPLLAVEGFSHLLQEDYEVALDAEGKRYVSVIRQNVAKMHRRLDGLQAFLRASRNAMEVKTLDMTALAQKTFAELSAKAPDRNIRFVLEELPPAQGDGALIRQLFDALLENAIKFTREQPEAVIQVSGKSDGSKNLYCVKDNGVGFDMRFVHKLFNVFQRLHATEEYEGVGVGLAIVKRIVERHGGCAWAEGAVGAGGAVHFALPAQKHHGEAGEIDFATETFKIRLIL